MTRLVTLLLLLCALATPAYAQSTAEVRVGQTFRVVADHPRTFATVSRLYFNGVQVGTDLPLAEWQGTLIAFPQIVASTKSSVVVTASIVDTNGKEWVSLPLTLLIKDPDGSAPTGIRILVIMPDGTFRAVDPTTVLK